MAKKLSIITADERLQEQSGVKMIIFGPIGIGKTTLLKTLTEPTLCLDMEAGLLAVQDWKGDSITLRTWKEARAFACLLGGPNPSIADDKPYSEKHYKKVLENYGDPQTLDQYRCIFIDSITVASRLCLEWCKTQPEVHSERTGKLDLRAAYGLLATEMMGLLNQLQHVGDRDIILVGVLEKRLDSYQRPYWSPQIEGSKTALELPGIVDEVISFVVDPREPEKEASNEEESAHPNATPPPKTRVFVCQTLNPWGYPAKDRSGRLQEVEEPDLGKLLAKIKQGRVSSQPSRGRLELFPAYDENTAIQASESPAEALVSPEHKESLTPPLQANANPEAISWLNTSHARSEPAPETPEAAGSPLERQEPLLNQPLIDEKETIDDVL